MIKEDGEFSIYSSTKQDAVKEDMQVAGFRVEDTKNRLKMETGDTLWQSLKRVKP